MMQTIDQFLLACGSAAVPHSGRSLYQHLRGTEQLLRAWSRDDATCLAGLFHSIYGTNAFRHAGINTPSRATLCALIGEQAEHLVYLFHSSSRPYALIEALGCGGIVSRIDGQFLALDETDIVRLIEIECANLIDQHSGSRFFSMLREELDLASVTLDPAVMQAVAALPRQPGQRQA